MVEIQICDGCDERGEDSPGQAEYTLKGPSAGEVGSPACLRCIEWLLSEMTPDEGPLMIRRLENTYVPIRERT